MTDLPVFPVPPPDDVTAPWWGATREHRYTVQRCAACGHVQHPPRAVCVRCGSTDDLALTDASGNGTVDAWTVVHRAPRAGVAVPYTIARIRLAEGPIVLSRLDGDDWTIGDPVRVGWVDLDDGRALPVFHRATD
ncbi:Zn-ribbon domain-containing OB-fold protein [Asanoa sp. NPDC050611]|uniref:Zn-ribbon domain-containing OB-fold protein n=1 Tax=Asanoa sp. NPDC050611 TaxID=3157098 RepID=UPI00340ADF75